MLWRTGWYRVCLCLCVCIHAHVCVHLCVHVRAGRLPGLTQEVHTRCHEWVPCCDAGGSHAHGTTSHTGWPLHLVRSCVRSCAHSCAALPACCAGPFSQNRGQPPSTAFSPARSARQRKTRDERCRRSHGRRPCAWQAGGARYPAHKPVRRCPQPARSGQKVPATSLRSTSHSS